MNMLIDISKKKSEGKVVAAQTAPLLSRTCNKCCSSNIISVWGCPRRTAPLLLIYYFKCLSCSLTLELSVQLAVPSLSLPPAVCAFMQRGRDGRACVRVRLSDWLTLLTSSIWTIKSAAVLRREGYDGWSFNLAASLPSLLTPTHSLHRPPTPPSPRCGVFLDFIQSVISLWGRTARGSKREAGCEGVNPERGRGAPSRWRLFCSHGSVSERTPMQLRQLAPLCLTAPTHPHNWLHTCALTCFPPYTHIFWVVFMSTCTDVCQRWCQAVGGERRGAARSRTMPLSHRISQAGGQRRAAVGMTLQFCSGREWRRASGGVRAIWASAAHPSSLPSSRSPSEAPIFLTSPPLTGSRIWQLLQLIISFAQEVSEFMFLLFLCDFGSNDHMDVVLCSRVELQSGPLLLVFPADSVKTLLTLHQNKARNNKQGCWKFENLYSR